MDVVVANIRRHLAGYENTDQKLKTDRLESNGGYLLVA